MNIVIIEDEKLTARDLERTLLSIDASHNIKAILHSKKDAIEYFENFTDFDLIFSDIQLGDGLSFEIFETVDVKTPIIYVTAFNSYALNAFKTFGVDYVLKPFTGETIAAALQKFSDVQNIFSKNKTTDYTELISLLKNESRITKTTSVLVQKGDKIIPLKSEEIALFYTEFNTVFAITFANDKFSLGQTLNTLATKFTPAFFRANRQFLVNRKAVKDASQHFNRKLLVNLNISFQEQIFIGKVKVTSFLDWLQNY